MNSHDQKHSEKKIRGPKRLEYIPEMCRGIRGVEELTTVRQLEILAKYLKTDKASRLAFVRLGASVPIRKSGGLASKPSVTYAVDVDGVVSVLRREQDPRSSVKWMKCIRRPWSLCRLSLLPPPAKPPACLLVATLAILEEQKSGDPEWLRDGVPPSLRPDMRNIFNVWPCFGKRDRGGADRNFVVEGTRDWWLTRSIPELSSLYEPFGEMMSGENGVIWVGRDQVIEFAEYGYADAKLIPHIGEVMEDPIQFVRDKLQNDLATRVGDISMQAQVSIPSSALTALMHRHTAGIDIPRATLSQIDSVANAIWHEAQSMEEVVA